MQKIQWTKDGINSLYKILEHYKSIAGENSAQQIYKKIMREIDLLEMEEVMTKQIQELHDIRIYDVYELSIQPWKVYCKIQESNKKVFILFVLDSRKKLEEILISKVIDSNV